VRLGPLTPYAVSMLRHLKQFFGIVFDMKTERSSSTIFLTCVGAGLKNTNRKIT
jgi:RNA 3'-terminal phosphate cyclase-like protein